MPGRRRRGRREARCIRGAASTLRRRRIDHGRPGHRSCRRRECLGRANMLSIAWHSGSHPLIIYQSSFGLTATEPLFLAFFASRHPGSCRRYSASSHLSSISPSPLLHVPPSGAPGSVATRRSITSSAFLSSYYLVYRFTPPFWLDLSRSTLTSWSFHTLATFCLRIPLAILQLDRSSHSFLHWFATGSWFRVMVSSDHSQINCSLRAAPFLESYRNGL